MTQTEFAKQVVEKIKTGNLKMLPKKKFVLKMVLGILGAIVLVLCAVFFLSLIIYITRKTGAWHLPAMGFKGLMAFLFGGFPWLLVLCLLVFIGLLEYYFRQFSFAYRRAILSISGILFVGTILGAIFVEMSGMHNRLESMQKLPGMPKFGPMYERFGAGFEERAVLGTVEEVMEQGMLVKDIKGNIVEVEYLPSTRFPQGEDFKKGDRVFIGGEKQGEKIKAMGVRKEKDQKKRKMDSEGFRGDFPPNLKGEVRGDFHPRKMK